MGEPVKVSIAAAIVLVVLAAYATKSDRPDPICTDRDMAVTERLFSACMASRSASSNDPFNCRKQTEQLSCKSWSRP